MMTQNEIDANDWRVKQIVDTQIDLDGIPSEGKLIIRDCCWEVVDQLSFEEERALTLEWLRSVLPEIDNPPSANSNTEAA